MILADSCSWGEAKALGYTQDIPAVLRHPEVSARNAIGSLLLRHPEVPAREPRASKGDGRGLSSFEGGHLRMTVIGSLLQDDG
jgi:hypothetical protein